MKYFIVPALVAAVLFIINIAAREEEQYKGLKIVGSFFLSILGFQIGHFLIPTGFFFALILIFRDKANRLAKLTAAGLGLVYLIANILEII